MLPVEDVAARHLEALQLGKSIQPAGENSSWAVKTDLDKEIKDLR